MFGLVWVLCLVVCVVVVLVDLVFYGWGLYGGLNCVGALGFCCGFKHGFGRWVVNSVAVTGCVGGV